jgi:hypothetical protein
MLSWKTSATFGFLLKLRLLLLLLLFLLLASLWLMLQDYFLRTWFSSYLYGQLSWVQLARMHVSSYV